MSPSSEFPCRVTAGFPSGLNLAAKAVRSPEEFTIKFPFMFMLPPVIVILLAVTAPRLVTPNTPPFRLIEPPVIVRSLALTAPADETVKAPLLIARDVSVPVVMLLAFRLVTETFPAFRVPVVIRSAVIVMLPSDVTSIASTAARVHLLSNAVVPGFPFRYNFPSNSEYASWPTGNCSKENASPRDLLVASSSI